ncbi:MAG: ribosome biogenesis GTPase Der [Acidimicrobiales bacterium]
MNEAAPDWSGLPVVAIVGRPNVGKSELFNRIIGRRVAIVEGRPGVTRDRNVMAAEWNGVDFALVDTGGWMVAGDDLETQVSAQAERAIADADLVLLVLDAMVGVTAEDEEVARRLRRSDIPVMVIANKVDSSAREADAWALSRVGLGEVFMISALHGRGTGDMLDAVVRGLARSTTGGPDQDLGVGPDESPTLSGPGLDGASPGPSGDPGQPRSCPAVALVGRPNVGKSTLFNRLIGETRSVVHDLAGTTRDSVDTVVETTSGQIRFIDTAGMRRKSRVGEGAEYYSLVRALQSIDRADVALLLIDATSGVTHQDQRLAERIDAAGSPVVLVINKWEMLGPEDRAEVLTDVEDRLAFLGYAPILKVSAQTGLGVHKLLPALDRAIQAYQRRVPTAELNRVVKAAQAAHPAPSARILYAVQGAAEPPTFTLFASRALPAPYLRYIERKLREHFDFGPTAIKMRVRRRSK